MAFGAVATDNIKAQLALIAAGIINKAGVILVATAAVNKIGISSVAVATLDVILVKKVTKRQIDKTSNKIGNVDNPVNQVPINSLKRDAENALAMQMPPANSKKPQSQMAHF